MGREGRAAAGLLVDKAGLFVVSDKAFEEAETQWMDVHSVDHAVGPGALEELANCDVVIRSPGVSVYRDEVARLHEAGVPITTGTNLWFAENPDAYTIAVTGTKGKSTTSSLIAHLLNTQGRTAQLAGNIGKPLLDLIGEAAPELYVLELSAQQIADLEFSPNVGVLTNLYREHLDWHKTEENYINDKLNLFKHRPGMAAVLNAEDPRQLATEFPDVEEHWYGAGRGFHVEGTAICGERPLYSQSDTKLRGRHNLLNICAALTAVAVAGGEPLACRVGLSTFAPLRHRLEEVATINGVTYFNDSISTTPKATIAALDAFAGTGITLLVGGYERNQDYLELREKLAADPDVRAVLTLPDYGARIYEQIADLSGSVRPGLAIEPPLDVRSAVRRAAELTPPGGVVLLSPAAPSFGHFKNFEERGDVFIDAVRHLPGLSE